MRKTPYFHIVRFCLKKSFVKKIGLDSEFIQSHACFKRGSGQMLSSKKLIFFSALVDHSGRF